MIIINYNRIIKKLQDKQSKEPEIGLSLTDLFLCLQLECTYNHKKSKDQSKGRKISFSIMTTKKNSLLFKIKIENEKIEFQVNDFIDLFLEGRLFE